jgi:hypothetical protein
MLIPRTYYRVGPKGSFKTEAAAKLEAEYQMKDSKQMTSVNVYKCVALRHDESSMTDAKEDCPEWRIDDVIELTPSISVNFEIPKPRTPLF